MEDYTPSNRDRNKCAEKNRMKVSGYANKLTIVRQPRLTKAQKKEVRRAHR